MALHTHHTNHALRCWSCARTHSLVFTMGSHPLLLWFSPFFPPRRFYAQVFPTSGTEDISMLDMCSSWVSHYPPGYKAGRMVGE